MAGRHVRGDAQALARMERELGSEAHQASAWVTKGHEIAVRMGSCNIDVLVAFERAVELDPTLPAAWLGYAMALRANRNYEDALDAEARALALDLENPSAWLSRSRTLTLLSRYEEALTALERAMHLNPMVNEDWSARERKQYLLNRLGRSSEAEEAQKRYRELLEIAAGALPTEDNATLSPAQKQLLVDKIYYDEGSLEDQELWLVIIQRQKDQGYFSEMEALARIVGAKRLATRLREELGSPLTREQLVALLQQVMRVEGTEEEQEAWLRLIAEETGASFGSITDDIYWPKQEMTAEEIVERAIVRGKRA
jgi:tetratricopeptide (TPR) repeat protein